ncbi:MAG TPA: hypothetical protein VII48_10415, partial [Rhizomicrobium sp.]
GVGLILFSQGTARWLKNHPGEPLFFAALAVNAVAGCLLLLFGFAGWGGLLGLLPWTFVYLSMTGSINANGAGLALHHFGHAAGMASALIGIFLYGGATLASAAMGAFVTPTSPVPMAGLMALFGLSGVATYLLFRPRAPG